MSAQWIARLRVVRHDLVDERPTGWPALPTERTLDDMGNNGPFGFDPEEFDRMVREAGEGLRDAFDRINSFVTSGDQLGFAKFFDEFARGTRAKREPETTGETGEGVWAIYTVQENGGAHVEEVYASELDALRANQHNTDNSRKVRFLPYGIAVSVLDRDNAADADD